MRARTTGFTLMETIMAVVLVGILAAFAVPLLSNGTRAYRATATGVTAMTEMRYAIARFAREVREVRRDPSSPFDYDIDLMAPDAFVFTKRDGVKVRLAIAPPALSLDYSSPVTAPAPPLATHVDSGMLRYFKRDGVTAATSKRDIAFVEITLALARDGALDRQRARVALRNAL